MSGQDSTPTLRTSSFVLIATLLMTVAIVPAWAQNTVSPTARQAAALPQYASRLGHAAQTPNRLQSRPRGNRTLPQYEVMYENGPVNGTTDAWTINYGFVASDTFTVSGNGNITGLVFAAWLFPGDTLTSAEVSITSDEFGGTTYFDQVVNFSESDCTTNQYAYDVCTESGSFTLHLPAGTYWVNLQSASVPNGDPVYWDENSGVGCGSPGCPSQASENELGTIPSESFSVLGNVGPPRQCNMPGLPSEKVLRVHPSNDAASPQAGFKVLHTFTGGADGDNAYAGLSIDAAGNLYGPANGGGQHGAGDVYKMSQQGDGWIFNVLHSFTPDDGYPGTPLVTAPDDTLYGVTAGGIFQLRPGAAICRAIFCGWWDDILYAYPADTYLDTLAYGPDGSLYGVAAIGGAYQRGEVYQLQPSTGGWQYHALYDFTGDVDGQQPNSVNVDPAGNIFGTALGGGAHGCGTVFEVSPTQSGWTQKTLYAFRGQEDSGYPLHLVRDDADNLYGVTIAESCRDGNCLESGGSTVFMLSPGQDSWNYTLVSNFRGGYGANISIDSARNLYVNVQMPGYVFKLTPDGGGWTYTDLHDFDFDGWLWPAGKTVIDAEGNVYGTTSTAGGSNGGTVWQITP